jgi:cephalosporin hydroxylase
MDFELKRLSLSERNWNDLSIRKAAKEWEDLSVKIDYAYMFDFCGLPIIQHPQDVCMLQEVIWKFNPTLVIETGVARGGSLVLSAAILSALSYSEILNNRESTQRRVVGVDIDIRAHNREAILNHPLSKMIHLVQGSSIEKSVINEVKKYIKSDDRVIVILDSNHTEDHVLKELELYSEFVTSKSAILVMDTAIEFINPLTFNTQRSWGPSNSPYSAVKKFLKSKKGKNFSVNIDIEKRHLITCAPEGLLVRS